MYLNLGHLLHRRGETRLAEMFTRLALKTPRCPVHAHLQLGEILLARSEPKAALAQSLRFLETTGSGYLEGSVRELVTNALEALKPEERQRYRTRFDPFRLDLDSGSLPARVSKEK